MATPREKIELLVHKTIDQLTVLKASSWMAEEGGNGESIKEMKNALTRLKSLVTQMELATEEFDHKQV